MKKIFSEIYKKDSNLEKYWWYRLVRVCLLTFFVLLALTVTIILIVEPPVELLGKHNSHINNSLYSFTVNYEGKDINTIPKFIEQKGKFGILNNNKLTNKTGYLSSYDLGTESFCLKNLEKYSEGIAIKFSNESKIPLEEMKKKIEEDRALNPDRKCYLIGSNYEELKLENGVSKSLVNFRPNVIYYIEIIALVLIGSFLIFTIISLIYWGPVRYIIYGREDKKH